MQSEANDDGSGRLFAGKYRLIEPLAKGGMGVVYVASQEPLGRRVAVKILRDPDRDSRFRDRFFSEASICAGLSHPNIVTVHDYGEAEDGALFMVMEYVHGETLDRLLGGRGRLDVDVAISLVDQVASALEHAHQVGIVHRDLKPSNIVVQRDKDRDVVKVLDFGIAKSFRTSQRLDASDLTDAGKLVGTPRYMAPEQIRRQELGPRTDLYALGVLGYVMMSGRAPFDGDSDVALMNHHLYTTPPPVALPPGHREPELDWLFSELMAKAPEARPEDATVLRAQLDAIRRLRAFDGATRHDLSSSAPTRAEDLDAWVESRAAVHERRLRRRWVRAAAVGVPLVLVGSWWWARQPSASSAESPAAPGLRADPPRGDPPSRSGPGQAAGRGSPEPEDESAADDSPAAAASPSAAGAARGGPEGSRAAAPRPGGARAPSASSAEPTDGAGRPANQGSGVSAGPVETASTKASPVRAPDPARPPAADRTNGPQRAQPKDQPPSERRPGLLVPDEVERRRVPVVD